MDVKAPESEMRGSICPMRWGETSFAAREAEFQTFLAELLVRFSRILLERERIEAAFAIDGVAPSSRDAIEIFARNKIVTMVSIAQIGVQLAICLPNDFFVALIEAMMGGGSDAGSVIADRPVTRIEQVLVGRLARRLTEALQDRLPSRRSLAFDISPACRDASLRDCIEGDTTLLVRARAKLNGHAAMLHFVAPPSFVDFVARESRAVERPNPGAPPHWDTEIARTLGGAHVVVRALVRDKNFTLGDVAMLRAGQILPLTAGNADGVLLESDDQPLFLCAMGQRDGRYTVRVEQQHPRQAAVGADATGL